MHNLFMLIIAIFLKGVQTLFIQNKRLKGEIIHTSLKSRENHLILKHLLWLSKSSTYRLLKKLLKNFLFFQAPTKICPSLSH